MTYGKFRLEIHGDLVLDGPFHIGSPDQLTLSTDMPALRWDDRQPYIPGTSLRGVIRAHLERERSLLGCPENVLTSLFGHAGKHRQDGAATVRGRLRIFDSFLAANSTTLSDLRDHVKISNRTGAAEDKAKFDRELISVPPHYAFALHIIYEGDTADDDELILLREAVRALEAGELTIGGSSATGCGALHLTNISKTVFDRTTKDGLLAYFRARVPPPGRVAPSPSATFAFKSANAPRREPTRTPWNTISFTMQLQCAGPLLVKAAKPLVKSKPEATYLTQPGSANPLIPGSSLRGVLRHRAELICASQMADLPAPSPVATLFGSAKDDATGVRGLLKVKDGSVPSDHLEAVCSDHVAVDRITHAAAATKKFDNRALNSPSVEFQIRIAFTGNPDHLAAAALLLLLVRDLRSGRRDLALGSQTSRGYGSIESAQIENITASFYGSLAEKFKSQSGETRPGRRILQSSESRTDKLFVDLCHEFNPYWQRARQRTVE